MCSPCLRLGGGGVSRVVESVAAAVAHRRVVASGSAARGIGDSESLVKKKLKHRKSGIGLESKSHFVRIFMQQNR